MVECYICKDEENNEQIIKCDCNLYFHKKCAMIWITECSINYLRNGEEYLSYICPQCRKINKINMKKIYKQLYNILYFLKSNSTYILALCFDITFYSTILKKKYGAKYDFLYNYIYFLYDYIDLLYNYILLFMSMFIIIYFLKNRIMIYLITKKSNYFTNEINNYEKDN